MGGSQFAVIKLDKDITKEAFQPINSQYRYASFPSHKISPYAICLETSGTFSFIMCFFQCIGYNNEMEKTGAVSHLRYTPGLFLFRYLIFGFQAKPRSFEVVVRFNRD